MGRFGHDEIEQASRTYWHRCDCPGITVLDYAGDGPWKGEEDYGSVRGRELAMKEYEAALVEYDPNFAKKGTRLDRGTGPEWPKGARSHAERRPVR